MLATAWNGSCSPSLEAGDKTGPCHLGNTPKWPDGVGWTWHFEPGRIRARPGTNGVSGCRSHVTGPYLTWESACLATGRHPLKKPNSICTNAD